LDPKCKISTERHMLGFSYQLVRRQNLATDSPVNVPDLTAKFVDPVIE
jgi:hypothetical protein